MAAWHCLALITPLDPVSGERVPVRVASAQLRQITGLGGHKWAPAMVQPPKLTWQTFEGDFSSGISVGNADISLSIEALAQTREYPDASRLYWPGAKVTLYLGKAGAPWPWATFFDGEVGAASGKGRRITLSAAVNGEEFEREILTATYAGTGGVEGDANLTGQVKPLALGWPQNVEPLLINAVDSIYQFSAYGAIEAVTTLYERGSAYGAAAANYASYSALQAASIANGKWATCLAEGLVRLGAPAYGVITGDIKGHAVSGAAPRYTGDQIALLADLAGVNSARIASASLAALDNDTAMNASVMLTEQTTFLAAARMMALRCNYQAGIWLTGKFFVAKPDLDRQEVMTLHAQGKRMPQVVEAQEENVSRPYWRVTFGAERSWRVHAPDEIASGGYNWRGTYSATASYRKDDVVYATDGRAFVYINATMASGNAPPALPSTSNSYWTEWSKATNGAPSGTTVGGLDADTVAGTINTDGTISTGNVVTDSVVDGAITTRARAFTSGTVALTSATTWYDLQSITVTVSSQGEEVDIDCDLQWVITDNCRVTLRLKRDSTVIFTTDDYAVNTSDNPTASFGYTDDPGAGTYTYTVQAYCNDASNASAKYRRMRALGPIR